MLKNHTGPAIETEETMPQLTEYSYLFKGSVRRVAKASCPIGWSMEAFVGYVPSRQGLVVSMSDSSDVPTIQALLSRLEERDARIELWRPRSTFCLNGWKLALP